MAKGSYNRKKGHDFERKIAKDFRELGYTETWRDYENRVGKGIDLIGTEPFAVQCKRKAQVSIKRALQEAIDGANGRIPIAVTQDNRSEVLVTMRWEDLKPFIKK